MGLMAFHRNLLEEILDSALHICRLKTVGAGTKLKQTKRVFGQHISGNMLCLKVMLKKC